MTAIHETAYPRLKPNPNEQELKQNFLPTPLEIELLKKNTSTKSSHNQLGFMLSLKCYQCLGYHIAINAIPKLIVEYVAKCIAVKIDKDKLRSYMKLKQRKRHKTVIRKYLNINESKKQRRTVMKSAGLKSATTKENLADIINDILEELIKNNFEIPAFSTLLRLARASRVIVSSALYHKIDEQLTTETKNYFDGIILSDSPVQGFSSGWEYLKQEMKKPSTTNIKQFIDYLDQLRQWREHSPIEFSDIPEHRLDQYIAEAMALDISDMRRIKSERRYALSAMFLYHQYAKSLDSIVTVLMRWMRKLKNDASAELQEIRNNNSKTTDELIRSLKKILIASKQEVNTPQEKLSLIESSFPGDVDATIEACNNHLIYADNNDLPLILKYYQSKRQMMFRLLRQIVIKSASKDIFIENLLEFVLTHQRSHGDSISIHLEQHANLEWLDDQWFQFVTGNKTRTFNISTIEVNKHKFELASFKFILDEIRCADAFVVGSYENDDPNKQLLSWSEFYQQLKPYTELIGKSEEPNLFIKQLQEEHQKAAINVNRNFIQNEYLNIVDGEPVLKRAETKKASQNQVELSKLVASKMPLTNIISVLYDVESWLSISRYLKPISGYEPKINDYDLRFIATSFAYGCNVGPVQAERCLEKYSRKQIAWLFNHHITELRLNRISETIIKAYKQFELPYIWGDGESASVDGTYWDMYTNNLLAEHHIRYGKYGGIGYYHVSDQYVALFGNFIPCGVYEATYIFDGIFESEEALRPNKIHGDTHAQNEVVFGFAYLLAITLMPRIRSFKHLNFYRPADMNDKSYQHIKEIFCTKEINWQLIESMYHDMLRVVMSIQKGKIKASTILKKLCSKSKKNKLHQAFRELGRVVRTIFLLNYIADVELRKEVQAATCRSEEFNDFIDWVAFGNDNTIHDNHSKIQQKIIAFGRMVANAVMFHTIASTTKVLNQLKIDGIEYKKEDLSILSAYYRENINRYGVFDLSRSRQVMPLEFNIEAV